MNPLGGIGIAWFMLSGYSGLCSWWFSPEGSILLRAMVHGGFHLRVHLWTATQEQRGFKITPCLD